MKLTLSLLALCVLLTWTQAAPQRGGGNVAQIGNGDITAFLNDRSTVQTHINCVKGTGPCTRLGNQLKQALPEVINNRCSRCNANQANNARKLINFVQKNYPRDYQAIMARYLRSG